MAVLITRVAEYNGFFSDARLTEFTGDGRRVVDFFPAGGGPELEIMVGATPKHGVLFHLPRVPNTSWYETGWVDEADWVWAYTYDFADFRPVAMPDGASFHTGVRGEDGSEKYVTGVVVSVDGGGVWFRPALGATTPNTNNYEICVVEDKFVAYAKVSNLGWSFALSSDGLVWAFFGDGADLGGRRFAVGRSRGRYYAIGAHGVVYQSAGLAGPFTILPGEAIPLAPDPDPDTGHLLAYSHGEKTVFLSAPVQRTQWGSIAAAPVRIYEATPTHVFDTGWVGGEAFSLARAHNSRPMLAATEGFVYSTLAPRLRRYELASGGAQEFDVPAIHSWCHASYVNMVAMPGASRVPVGGPSAPVIPPPFWRDHTVTHEVP